MKRGKKLLDIDNIQKKIAEVKEKITEIIIGLDDAVDMLFVAIISGGHILIEGAPGLGKTTLAKTFANSIG
jgi:MoxR-like ATPase